MNHVGNELATAVDELCYELFSSSSADDAVAVLRAIASLALSSRTAQTVVGRALIAEQASRTNKTCVNRLQSLVERHLYNCTSSLATIQLLSVLAHNNLVNQRRIVRHVRGVFVTSSTFSESNGDYPLTLPSHAREPLMLLVVSLPATLRARYKQWRHRVRELRGSRVPTGDPPSKNGIPAPCYCNDCLGSSQHLTTWSDHYHDLSRWSQQEGFTTLHFPMSLEFHGEAFLQRVLDTEYTLVRSPWTTALREHTNTVRRQSHSDVAVGYFFVPSSAKLSTDPSVGHSPDPRYHVCAIEIDQSLAFVNSSRQDHITLNDKNEKDPTADAVDTLDRVLLFHTEVVLHPCSISKTNLVSEEEWSLWSTRVIEMVEGMKAPKCISFELTANQLLHEVQTNHALTPIDRSILCGILQFLDPHICLSFDILSDVLSWKKPSTSQTIGGGKLLKDCCSEPRSCDVRVWANVSDQYLEIVAHECDGSVSRQLIRSTALFPETSNSFFSHVFALDDKSLCDILKFCRLCKDFAHADDHSNVNEWVCLILEPSVDAHVSMLPCLDANISNDIEPSTRHSQSTPSSTASVYGLSQSTERLLLDLTQFLASHSRVLLTDVAQHLRIAIQECDVRIMWLARECGLPSSLREAARERCRVCRDLLVQAGKRLKLNSLTDAPDLLSHDGVRRLQHDIGRIIQLSKTCDAWEVTDPRIKEFDLSRREWGSGIPDPEFYINAKAHARLNRSVQRHLNQRLVDKTAKN